MEYLHFEHLKDRKLEINNWSFPERQPMFYYAALHWFEHISDLGEAPTAMLSTIKSLFSLGNGGQRAWLSVHARFVSVTLNRSNSRESDALSYILRLRYIAFG